jgi:trk system potassium uptake protein TrkA
MNIIIVGIGEIGRHLALSLSRESHEIVVIETDEKLASELDSQVDARVMCRDGASVNTLLEANVAECDLLFAVTSGNNTNMVVSSIAKQLGAKKVICRVHPTVQREEWIFDHRGHFNIDHIFSSERLASVELSKHIRNPDSLLVEDIAHGRVELQQVKISDNSTAHGKSLSELELPPRIRIGDLTRGGQTIGPNADEKLHAGDHVTVFGEPRKLQEIINRLRRGESSDDSTKVVIFGGGEYGFSLAQMLEGWNYRVRIFETNPSLCEDLTERLASTTVLNVDATSLSELREEQVGDADFFVATSESDEDNVMTCLQAHNLGAKHCLTLIHRADYADAISSSGAHIGIMAAVSPREATRRELERFVTSDRYHVIKALENCDLIEASVPEGAEIVDKKVSEVEWPEGSGLVALLHGVHASVPAADDVIHAGDHIYAMVSTSARNKLLKVLTK